MSPEELEATREGANVDYAPDIAYEDWQAMARALLAHIDSQAVTINNLAAALDEAKVDQVNFSSACQEELDTQAAQIEALKEKLVSMTTTAIWKASYDSLTGKYTISVTASQNGQNVNLPVKTYATVGSVVLGKTTSDTKLNLLGYGEVSLDKVEQIAL